MGYVLGIAWCLIFGGFGWYLLKLRKKYADYSTFVAQVQAVEENNGRHTAILNAGRKEIGTFSIPFQDLGDFTEGNAVECMWDGKNPATARQDLRKNQRLGIYFSFFAVAVMLIILVMTLIFS